MYVQLFFFSSSFLYSIPTVECCVYMTNLKLSLNRASLSLSLYNTTYIAWTIAEVITLEFCLTERRPQRHLISPTAGAAAAAAVHLRHLWKTFYREFILLDLQHIILGRRSIERTGERLLQGLFNQQSSCSLIYRVRKRRPRNNKIK